MIFSHSLIEQLPNTYRSFFGKFSILTSLQKAMVHPILNGQDVVLQAGTGSGKTEAVLAPATEKLMTSSDPFTILYIVPTRALALDMNRRIAFLYKELGLKAGFRTGDGKTLRGRNPHLLILTPESLDVLMGSQNADNRHFLKHVKIMIIDEIHAFHKNERGKQLFYLRKRLELQAAGVLQTIALSATVPDLEEVASFFNLKNVFYYKELSARKLQPHFVHFEDETEELVPFFNDLFSHFGCRKLLVFANSRKKCEQLFEFLNQNDFFSNLLLLHYSNLSTKERRAIENAFRNNKKSICIATSTLEMGVDIGDVDAVILMGPPPTTMAFLQRIGRANRRQSHVNFWGVCQGVNAGRQLLQFLAMFELSQEGQLERRPLANHYSVLFQQTLSCLYAKKRVSQNSLNFLLSDEIADYRSIFDAMISQEWLQPSGLYAGGWRYLRALKQQQIWSNFPPTEEEYEVILDQEKIAILPLSLVRQLEIGNLIQLTGKVLKILRIEEKKSSQEVWVEESHLPADKDLLWMGFGAPISYEVAQKIQAILTNKKEPSGLLTRTRRLLEKERIRIESATSSPSGFCVYRLGNGFFRYETFLGTTGNFIIYHLVKTQFKMECLSLCFDELGLESNVRIPFESISFPETISSFQEWVVSHFQLFKGAFAWNRWMQYLPQEYQCKEMSSNLLDLRLLENFKKFRSELRYIKCPEFSKELTSLFPLKGIPKSFEREREEWGELIFPTLPLNRSQDRYLTATTIQNYVKQNLCPRWARLQNLHYTALSHPRFKESERASQLRKHEGRVFKSQVIEFLKKKTNVYWATKKFTWKDAVEKVISEGKPFFLGGATLEMSPSLKGFPDLIYFKHEGSHVCLEVWDIKNGQTVFYAEKWRIAFYAYLLELLLKETLFSFPVKGSDLGGFIYRPLNQEKFMDRIPFSLEHYKKWMPRLLTKWKADAQESFSIEKYTMGPTCTSCSYFSYCYQERLFKETLPLENQSIIDLGIASNDFPKNTKQWFFIYKYKESLQWECWERGGVKDRGDTLQEVQKQWISAIGEGKNPHLLVYEAADWYGLPNTLQNLGGWTSIQAVLKKHFQWPVSGRLTATQVALCLGLKVESSLQLSLYHKELPSIDSFEDYRHIWNWTLSHVKSNRVVSFDKKRDSVPLICSYLAVHHRESECRIHEILEFQKQPLEMRVDQFRSIGPLTFLGTIMEGKQKSYLFTYNRELPVSKLRMGDFLKLSPVGSSQIQEGHSVILESYSPEKKILSLRALSKKMWVSKHEFYALDEDATDWNGTKIKRVLNLLKNPKFRPELIQLLHGQGKVFSSDSLRWVEKWLLSHSEKMDLNLCQRQALMLPFLKNVGLIEGPPGTGKTHLLVWTLFALIAHAQSYNRPIKILITAATHQAIDQILKKAAVLFSQMNVVDLSLWKYGRSNLAFQSLGIHSLEEYGPLMQNSHFVLGATGFGVAQLLGELNFPQLFDWIIFDEASQVLPSYALLSLIFGKGNALFYGDTQQLPPILKGNYEGSNYIPCSILAELISRFGASNRVQLNETYRMNEEISRFASEHWYEGNLSSCVKNQKLELSSYPLFRDSLDACLDPSKSLVVVQLDHVECRESSSVEAHFIAKAVKRLINDYSVSAYEIGIISPHRLQNNLILAVLKETLSEGMKMPKIDTVERMQGLEFDIVIFSATASDKEVIHSPFLRDYRRLNVILTRARKKVLFIASALFFQTFPPTEKELIRDGPFSDLVLLPNEEVVR